MVTQDGKAVPFVEEPFESGKSIDQPCSMADSETAVPGNDNRHIVDTEKNQALSSVDIDRLREQGTSALGMALDELIAFQWAVKERKPGVDDLRFRYLRFDTLSRLLALANVRAGSNVLLAETCAGLVLGAVLERLGDPSHGGRVLQFFHGTAPPRPEINSVAMQRFDSQVHSVPFREVVGILTGTLDQSEVKEEPAADSKEDDGDDVLPSSRKIPKLDCAKDIDANSTIPPVPICSDKDQLLPDDHVNNGDRRAGAQSAPTPIKWVKRRQARAHLTETHHDALIIVTRFHPTDMTLLLAQFLPPGKPVVIYSQYLQPLTDLYNAVRQRQGAVLLKLTDSNLRSIQVLDERTHPDVSTYSSSGYLLSFYTVEPKPTLGELFKTGLIQSALPALDSTS